MSAKATCCRTEHNFCNPDYKSPKEVTDLKLNNNEYESKKREINASDNLQTLRWLYGKSEF